MSCCADSYNNIPCCCSTYVTTTTTCPFGICCESACEDGTPCVEISSTDCVFYDGPTVELDCLGVTISQGESYTQVLQTILSNFLQTFNFSDRVECPSGPVIDFTISEQLACQAANDRNTCTLYGYEYKAISVSVGHTLYTDNCSPIPNGYYVYVTPLDEALVVYIVDNVIQSVTTC